MTRAAKAAAPLQIVQITDFHLLSDPQATMLGINTEQSFEAVLNRVASLDLSPDLFLLTGDLVQDAEPSTYHRLRSLLFKLPGPIYCLPGNHDDPALMKQCLADGERIFVEPRIDLGGWDIVCLNSTVPHQPCGFLPDEELRQLDEQLNAIPDGHHVLVTMHHPPMALSSRWLDTMMIRNADEFWARLERHKNVRGVVIGHVHQAWDEIVRGVRVLASPSTCFQFKPLCDDFAIDAVPQGFRRISLNADGSINSEVERLDSVPPGLDLKSIGY